MEFFNKLLTKKRLWRTLTVVFLTLALIVTIVTELAYKYETVVNNALKTTSSKQVEIETSGDEEVDSNYFPSDYESYDEIVEYGRQVSEEVESEGLVLMKNKDAALPLASGTNVSAVFQGAVDFSYGASGSGAIDASSYTDFKTALEEVNLNVNQTLWDYYVANPTNEQYRTDMMTGNNIGMDVNARAWSEYSDDARNSISTHGGAAVAVINRTLCGEGTDAFTVNSDGYDGSYLSLTEDEISVLSALTELKEQGAIDSIIVIINTAQILQTAFLQDDWTVSVNGNTYTVDVDACMWVGNVGMGGINAVADALVGNVNPSGRLPDTYVNDNFSSPAMATWVASQNDYGKFASTYADSGSLDSTQYYYSVYVEGIYVGYRYYETRYEDIVTGRSGAGDYDYAEEVSRPFGYGLSYTSFEYSDYTVTRNADGDFEVSVTVTNTGDVAGKEVVQIYIQKPYTQYDANADHMVEKASVELAGFAKTDMLYPASEADADHPASQTLTVTVERESFKSCDADGYGTYILEEGDYYIAAGADSHDALNNILAAKGYGTADGMDAEGNSGLAYVTDLGVEGDENGVDATTYAKSSETGNDITNQLEFADINKYEGAGDNSVTYASRSNWTDTYPDEAAVLTFTDRMREDLSNSKPIEEDPSASMPSYGASDGLTLIALRGYDYDYEMWDVLLNQMTWDEQLSIVTRAYLGTPGPIESISLDAIKATDGPTGVNGSQGAVSFPSEGIWAATFNTELIQKVGDAFAEDARANGYTGMYVPGVNLHRTGFGGRAHEYFSEDPFLSGVSAEYEIKGLQGKGVIVYIKHFAFNDQEDARLGIGTWLNEQSARELYLKPFEYAVSPSRGNAHGLMSSFNRAGCIWTSASEELLTNILRGEFGFDGVVLTDMVTSPSYMNYSGFFAGTDLYLSGEQYSLSGYESSPTFRQAVREAVHRYLYVVVNYSASMNGVTANTRFIKVLNWWQITLITLITLFFVLGAVFIVLMSLSCIKQAKLKNRPQKL